MAEAVRMDPNQRDHLALYIWDYFYIANAPRAGDRREWEAVERATQRIRESQIYLDPPHPADVRLRHARRVRNSARAALRSIAQLSVAPERWVIDGLVALERWTETMTEELRDEARRLILD